MARFPSTNVLTPTQAVGAPAVSNVVKTESARDARVFIDATVQAGGVTLDVDIEVSPDNITFYKVASFNQIIAVGKYVVVLAEEKLSTWLRLSYTPVGGATTIRSLLEKKHGV